MTKNRLAKPQKNRRLQMSNKEVKPVVGVGTKIPQGTVVAIYHDGVVVEKKGKKSTVGFKQVEQLFTKE